MSASVVFFSLGVTVTVTATVDFCPCLAEIAFFAGVRRGWFCACDVAIVLVIVR